MLTMNYAVITSFDFSVVLISRIQQKLVTLSSLEFNFWQRGIDLAHRPGVKHYLTALLITAHYYLLPDGVLFYRVLFICSKRNICINVIKNKILSIN